MPKKKNNQKHFSSIKVPNASELEHFNQKRWEPLQLSMTNKIEINDIKEKIAS